MNKQLLDKIEQALTAQQDTIQRQEQMLESKDRDIAHLQSLLEKLTATQVEQLERLPLLYENLKNTINEQRATQAQSVKHRIEYTQSMKDLTSESTALAERQIRLIELMKQYQSTIVPPKQLESVTRQLESELDELAHSQQKIINSQNSLKEQQEQLLKKLNS